ncbi:MAG: hypothetical protein KBC84_09565 [Proteobacteria bacterium]|nr:hypothetical protein [Pseudomonadota bacterium]
MRTAFPLEQCKSHTYINLKLEDYVKQRFTDNSNVRLAIIPFDVQESFAPLGNESSNFGRELARRFTLEFHKENLVPIVELFNRDRWPGKREEFFTGNYKAIDLARAAGYDLVMVGYLEELKDDVTLTIYTKIIDTQSNITIWDAQNTVVSRETAVRDTLNKASIMQKRPDLFNFAPRTEKLVNCTVYDIKEAEPSN